MITYSVSPNGHVYLTGKIFTFTVTVYKPAVIHDYTIQC